MVLTIRRTIPYLFSGLAIIVDEVLCRNFEHGQRVCKVAVEMVITAGSTAFTSSWAHVCTTNYDAIERACGQTGGSASTTTVGGYRWENGGYQITTVTFTTTIYASLNPWTSLTTLCTNGGYCNEWTCAATVCNEGPSV